jgi:hypothetical protein
MTQPLPKTTRTRVMNIVEEIYGRHPGLATDTRLMDIGGFTDFLTFFKRLELEFGILISNEETVHVLTIGSAIALIALKVNDQPID